MIEQKLTKEEFFDAPYHGVTTVLADVFGKDEFKNIPEAVLKAAGERGSAVHSYIETFINTGEWPEIELAYQIYIDYFKEFYEKYKPKFILSELMLISEKMKFKGIIDCVLIYKEDDKDICCMVDWKTSSSLNRFKTMCQLNMYRDLLIEQYDIDIDEIRTLSITKTGWRFSKFEIDENLTDEILKLYNLKKVYNGN